AFRGQLEGQPVHLSGRVVVDVVEAELLEPRRGPGAVVSLVVVAVDDDRAVAVQARGRGGGELLEGQVEGAQQVPLLVVARRQYLHQLRARRHQFLDLFAIRRPRHQAALPTTGRTSRS